MQLSSKQNEYILKATHRWNIKSGAVRSGKSFVDTAYMIPFRIRAVAGKPGLNVILGVSKESIERNSQRPIGAGIIDGQIYHDDFGSRQFRSNRVIEVIGEHAASHLGSTSAGDTPSIRSLLRLLQFPVLSRWCPASEAL